MRKDYEFWNNQNGIGLVWSNPDANDSVMIMKALLKPNFHLLLKIAERFGLERLKSEWILLQENVHEAAKGGDYDNEAIRLRRAEPIVTRCLNHMDEALRIEGPSQT